MFSKPSIKQNKDYCDKALGVLADFVDDVEDISKVNELIHDQTMTKLIRIAEGLIPKIDFSSLDLIPNFDKLCVYLQRLALIQTPRLEQILSVNAISKLFNNVTSSKMQFKGYYYLKLFQAAAANLASNSLEIRSAYMLFLQEALEAAEADELLQQAIKNSLLGVTYGLLTTDLSLPKLAPATLFKGEHFQTEKFIATAREYLAFLELLEVQVGANTILNQLTNIYDFFKTDDALFRNAHYFQMLIARMVDSGDEINQQYIDKIFECMRKIAISENISKDIFEGLIKIIDVCPNIQIHQFFSICILLLKHQHQHKLIAFEKLIEKRKTDLLQFVDTNDIRDEIFTIIEHSNYGQYIFEQPAIFEILGDVIIQVIYQNLGVLSLQSQKYICDTKEHKIIQNNLLTCQQVLKGIKMQKLSYQNYLLELLETSYEPTVNSKVISPLEVTHSIFKQILLLYSVSFFSNDFIKFAMSPSDHPGDNKVNGKTLFLIALRSHLSECKDLSAVSFLLTGQQNIVSYIIGVSSNLKNNPQDISNLTVLLGILRQLLEGCRQMVSYDYFGQNRDLFQQLSDTVLLPQIYSLDQADHQFTQTLIADCALDEDAPHSHEADVGLSQLLADVYSLTQSSVTGRAQSQSQTQFFNVRQQCFSLFSYISQCIPVQTLSIKLFSMIIKYLLSMSETMTVSASVLLSVLSLNKDVLNDGLKIYFGQASDLSKFKIIQAFSSNLSLISLVQRIVSKKSTQPSLVSVTPHSPLVNVNTVTYLQILAQNIQEFLLPTSDDQVKVIDLMLQELERYKQLQFGAKTIQIQNIMINPIFTQLADLIIMLPIQQYTQQPNPRNKLLTAIVDLTIDAQIQLEPELFINAINDYVSSQTSSQLKTTTLAMTLTSKQMQQELHKQQFVSRYLKLPLLQFSLIYPEFATTVIESYYQMMKSYFTASQYTQLTTQVIYALLDVAQYAVPYCPAKYHEILSIVTEFDEKQVANLPQSFGTLIVSRLKLFQTLSEYSPLKEKFYAFWLKALKDFVNYDSIFEVSGSISDVTRYDVIVEFFQIGVDFVKFNVQRTTQILNLLITNSNKNNIILLKTFLSVLNHSYLHQTQNQDYMHPSSIKSVVSNIDSKEQVVLLLTQLLYVEATYPQEYSAIITLLDSEIALNGIDLLFQLFSHMINRAFDPVALEDFNDLPMKQEQEPAILFYEEFLSQLIIESPLFQSNFISIFNRWNLQHITSRDVNSIFNLALQSKNLIIINLLVKFRTNDIDQSYKSKIVDAITSQFVEKQSCLQNIIYLQFIKELAYQVGKAHDILIRSNPDLILQIVTNVVRSIILDDEEIRFVSKKMQGVGTVFAQNVEVFGELQTAFVSEQLDSKDSSLQMSHTVRYFIQQYLSILMSNPTQRGFLMKLVLSLSQLVMENHGQLHSAQLYELFDVVNGVALHLVDIQEPLTTEELSASERTSASFIEYCFDQLDTLAQKFDPALVRRIITFLSLVLEVTDYNDVLNATNNLLAQYCPTDAELKQSINDSKLAFAIYKRFKRIGEVFIVPSIARALVCQRRGHVTALVRPIVQFVAQNTKFYVEYEYQMNITAGFYEGKVSASGSACSRAAVLPLMFYYQALKGVEKPAECESLDDLDGLLAVWQSDVSASGEQWLKKLLSLGKSGLTGAQELQAAVAEME